MKFRDLRDFLATLEANGDLVRIKEEIDPNLEMTEIADRTLRGGGPALLFENPKGYDVPLLANLFGTEKRVALGMGADSTEALREIGEPYGKGRNGKGWIVGLEDGSGDSGSMVSVPLRNYAVATSGTYQLNKPNPDANRSASHLLDPRTGKPVEHDLIAVNAFAPTARDADAWATALMILGPVKGLKKAAELDMVARFCSIQNGRIKISLSTAYQRLYSPINP